MKKLIIPESVKDLYRLWLQERIQKLEMNENK